MNMHANDLNYGMRADEARLNITWAGQNGDLKDPVPYGATDAMIREWATEAIASGGVVGIRADADAKLTGFVVDRFPATDKTPYHRMFLRPETPFG